MARSPFDLRPIFAAALFSTSSTALAQSAQDFVNKVAISDMFEIQSSQLALSKQADEDTKPLAQKMVQDHQKTSSELKAVVEGSMVKLILPATMDSEHQKMLNDLQAKDAAAGLMPSLKNAKAKSASRNCPMVCPHQPGRLSGSIQHRRSV